MLEQQPIPSRERLLLGVAAAFSALALFALALAPAARAVTWAEFTPRWEHALSLAFWLLAAVVGHLALSRRLPRRDPFLFPIAMLLSGWSIALVWRLAPAFGLRQSLWVLLSVLAMLAVIWPPDLSRWLSRYRYLALSLALSLTAATLIFGVNPSGVGPRLWLGFFGVYFQPAELLKLLLISFLAAYLADTRDLLHTGLQIGPFRLPALAYLGPLLLMWGFSLVLLFFQRDLGAGSLIFCVFLAMLYLATGRLSYPLLGLALLVGGGIVLSALFPVVQIRVAGWLNPWADPLGDSFQIVQSLFALANGGLLGQGPGLGAPGLIPVVHSDFVYAAIVEEWGLAGGMATLLLLLTLVLRGLRVSLHARQPYRALLAGGLSALLGLQTLIIVGGVTRALPLTGITLPFLSYGGSALLINFLTLALLLRLSHSATAPQ